MPKYVYQRVEIIKEWLIRIEIANILLKKKIEM